MSFNVKRGLFIATFMIPITIMSEYYGLNTAAIGAVTAGISSGVSVILFPDPKHLERLEREKQQNSDRS